MNQKNIYYNVSGGANYSGSLDNIENSAVLAGVWRHIADSSGRQAIFDAVSNEDLSELDTFEDNQSETCQ